MKIELALADMGRDAKRVLHPFATAWITEDERTRFGIEVFTWQGAYGFRVPRRCRQFGLLGSDVHGNETSVFVGEQTSVATVAIRFVGHVFCLHVGFLLII